MENYDDSCDCEFCCVTCCVEEKGKYYCVRLFSSKAGLPCYFLNSILPCLYSEDKRDLNLQKNNTKTNINVPNDQTMVR